MVNEPERGVCAVNSGEVGLDIRGHGTGDVEPAPQAVQTAPSRQEIKEHLDTALKTRSLDFGAVMWSQELDSMALIGPF